MHSQAFGDFGELRKIYWWLAFSIVDVSWCIVCIHVHGAKKLDMLIGTHFNCSDCGDGRVTGFRGAIHPTDTGPEVLGRA